MQVEQITPHLLFGSFCLMCEHPNGSQHLIHEVDSPCCPCSSIVLRRIYTPLSLPLPRLFPRIFFCGSIASPPLLSLLPPPRATPRVTPGAMGGGRAKKGNQSFRRRYNPHTPSGMQRGPSGVISTPRRSLQLRPQVITTTTADHHIGYRIFGYRIFGYRIQPGALQGRP